MKYLVNGVEFDNIEEATKYENSLKEQQKNTEEAIKDAIENNVNIAKVRLNSGHDVYFAVGIRSDKASIKKATYAYIEHFLGKRYDIEYERGMDAPNIITYYDFVSMNPSELSAVRSSLCNYLYENKNHRYDKMELHTPSGDTITFIDFLDDFGVEPVHAERCDCSNEFAQFLARLYGISC